MTDFWTAPKTNWNTNDVIAYTDLNRGEQNTKSLRDGVYRKVQGIGFSADNSVVGQDGVIHVYTGSCFSTDGFPINFSTAFQKNLNTWALGNGPTFGGMAPGVTVAAITWYYIFVIMDPATGNTEVMFDDNPSGTNVSNATYTKKRRVGSFKTDLAGSYSSFLLAEMNSDGDHTFINAYSSYSGTSFANSVGINNAYQLVTLSLGLGLALPALNVKAKLNIVSSGNVHYGLIANYTVPFTIPANLFAVVLFGEFVFWNPITGATGTADIDFNIDSSNQLRLAMYEASGGGSVTVLVRGFYDERLI